MFRRALHRLGTVRTFSVFRPVAVGITGLTVFVKPRQSHYSVHTESSKRHGWASPRRIIIDTDPGVDDALALLLALGSPGRLKVEGLTIVFGNGKDIRVLGANAKLVLRMAGATTVPVSLGESPAVSDGTVGATISQRGKPPVLVHGEDSIGNVGAKYGRNEADFTFFHQSKASDFIYDVCSKAPGEVTLVCIGPLSNIARTLQTHPNLPQLVDEVVIMGGAFGALRGNRSPAAEANFFDDPEAAQAVLRAGFRKVIVAGLDITHQTDMIVLREACAASPSSLSKFVWDVCEHFIGVYTQIWGQSEAPAHDTVPIMYLLRPDLFEAKDVRIEVETRGEFTRGQSVADWNGQWGRPPNCKVLTSILSRDDYIKEFVRAIASLPLK